MEMQKEIDVSALEKGEAGFVGREASTPHMPQCGPNHSPTSTTRWSTESDPTLSKKTHPSHSWPTNWSKFSLPIPKGKTRQRKKYRVPVKTRRRRLLPSTQRHDLIADHVCAVNDHPKGYPNLAAFLDSDEGFAVYRRFGYLQSRILLYKQEELRVLEEKLKCNEEKIANDDEDALGYREVFGPQAVEHRELLSSIETTFCSYAQILTAAQQMMALNKPSNSEYQSVGRYMNNRKPLGTEEATWIQHKEDIITLRTGREHAWLDDVVEGFLKLCHCKLIDFVFRSKETRKKTEIDSANMPARPPQHEDKYELYYTPSRIAKLANAILMIFVLLLLVLPIYLLYHMVHDIGTHEAYLTCIGTLLVFTLAFSSILSLFTKAKRHEILAAAAAYCAVLVVFLGNVVPSDAR
ncbi:hypothetical protein K458DRAFT_411061 [Lentithecium fluviatile CBS 122367]|uniref:DUF6594 domain-containing protein n=1 Tax=Lentithecium fluviatile CBS 122367 TaxID=1168545 RepID=A0A6G1ICF9_9PLEO|nr:hypothetical protein K458DRAFT_411061 [Lentithecium fluviatile CBS 122367]